MNKLEMTRMEMGQAIMDIAAGQSAREAFAAQADALACGIGGCSFMSGGTLEDALQLADSLHGEIKQHIIDNWGVIQRGDQ